MSARRTIRRSRSPSLDRGLTRPGNIGGVSYQGAAFSHPLHSAPRYGVARTWGHRCANARDRQRAGTRLLELRRASAPDRLAGQRAGGTAVIAIGATAAGALVGALIGAPLRKWHTVYQAR